MPAARSQVQRSFFQVGVDGLEHPIERVKGNGKHADGLHQHQTVESVDVEVAQPQGFGDDAVSAQQQNDRKGEHKRRRDHGQLHHLAEETLEGHIRSVQCKSKDETDKRGKGGSKYSQKQTVVETLPQPPGVQNLPIDI